MKRKVWGGSLALVGFLLSPLSWWNDMLVNFPLALGFGWLIALAYPPAFKPAVILGYWLTNVLGFWMMHRGAQQLFLQDHIPIIRRSVWRDLGVATAYTVLILGLLKFGWVEAPPELLP